MMLTVEDTAARYFDSLAEPEPLRAAPRHKPPPLIDEKTNTVTTHTVRKLEKYSISQDVKNLSDVKYRDRLYRGRAACPLHTPKETHSFQSRSPFVKPPFFFEVKSDPFLKTQVPIFLTTTDEEQEERVAGDEKAPLAGDEKASKCVESTLLLHGQKAQCIKDLVQAARRERKLKLAAKAKKSLEETHGVDTVDCYFGIRGRSNFFRSAGSLAVCAGKQHFVPGVLPGGRSSPKSPRTEFLISSSQKRKVLEPLLMRMDFSNRIDLAGRHLGDEKLIDLAQVIKDIPGLEHLNVSNNKLTSKSLLPLIDGIRHCKTLAHVDISCNTIDANTATALSSLLGLKHHCLRALVLDASDLDDAEASMLFMSLSTNDCLTLLSTKRNKFGNNHGMGCASVPIVAEEENEPNKPVTLSPALPEALKSLIICNHSLVKLDLSWNYLSVHAARCVGSALKWNKNLQELNLSYNNLKEDGSEELGIAMRFNHSLRILDLSHNSATPRAAIVIACALRQRSADGGEALHLNWHGNNIGVKGTKFFLRVLSGPGCTASRISLQDCTTTATTPELLDVEEPTGFYCLDLSRPYDYTIAVELIELTQNYQGYGILMDSLYYLPEGENPPDEEDRVSDNFHGIPLHPGRHSSPQKAKKKISKWEQIKMVKKTECEMDYDAHEHLQSLKSSKARVRKAWDEVRAEIRTKQQKKRESFWAVRAKANKAWQRAQDAILEQGRKKRLECKKTGDWTKAMEALWHQKQKAYIAAGRQRKENEMKQRQIDEETQEQEWFERSNQLDIHSATKVLSKLGIASTRHTAISGGYTSEKELASLLLQWKHIGDAATFAERPDGATNTPIKNKSSALSHFERGDIVVSYDKFLLIVLSLEATQEHRCKMVLESSSKPWPVPTKGWLKMDFVDNALEPRRSELTLSLYVCGLLHRLRGLVDAQLNKRMKDKEDVSAVVNENRDTDEQTKAGKLVEDVSDNEHSSVLENLLCQLIGLNAAHVSCSVVASTGLILNAHHAFDLLRLIQPLFRSSQDKIHSVATILPLVFNSQQRLLLVNQVLTEKEEFGLQKLLSQCNMYGVLMGVPTGHYKLNLGRHLDFQTAKLIVRINNDEKRSGRLNGRDDTSQNKDWNNFRNAFYNGSSQRFPSELVGIQNVLDPQFFYRLPRKNILEFDYVSTARPPCRMNDDEIEQEDDTASTLCGSTTREEFAEMEAQRLRKQKDLWSQMGLLITPEYFQEGIKNPLIDAHVRPIESENGPDHNAHRRTARDSGKKKRGKGRKSGRRSSRRKSSLKDLIKKWPKGYVPPRKASGGLGEQLASARRTLALQQQRSSSRGRSSSVGKSAADLQNVALDIVKMRRHMQQLLNSPRGGTRKGNLRKTSVGSRKTSAARISLAPNLIRKRSLPTPRRKTSLRNSMKKKKKSQLIQEEYSQNAMMSTLQRLMAQHYLTCQQVIDVLSLFRHTSQSDEKVIVQSKDNGTARTRQSVSLRGVARASISLRKGSGSNSLSAAIATASTSKKLTAEEKEAKRRAKLDADSREILYGSRKLPGAIKYLRSITKNQIQALTYMFGKILDIENFHLVLASFSLADQQEVILRLGWLNCFNPIHAERHYCFDFSIAEHRELFGMLLWLSKVEKGEEHTSNEWFVWPGEKESVPNWQFHDLSRKWGGNMPGSLPSAGFAWLGYSSVPDEVRKNLAPNYMERKKMQIRCLCAPTKRRLLCTKAEEAMADNADANLLSKVLHGEDIQLVHVPRIPHTLSKRATQKPSEQQPVVPKLDIPATVAAAVVKFKRPLKGKKQAAPIPGRFSTLGRFQRLGSINE